MSTHIDELLERMKALEAEIQAEFERRRHEFAFAIENRRIRFPLESFNRQRLHRVGVWSYLRQSRFLVLLTAPVVYAGLLAFVLLDLFLTVYQWLCFPLYGIPRVQRSEHLVFDRAELPYLNVIERLNCTYCSYGNGVASYFREVAARTEQYWCPIKHSRRLLDAHERYPRFFEFGDAQAYREGLEHLRRQYEARAPSAGSSKQPP
jgi:hypothetical protein